MRNSFIITIPSSEYLTFNFILTNQLSDDGLPRYLTVKAVGFFYSSGNIYMQSLLFSCTNSRKT